MKPLALLLLAGCATLPPLMNDSVTEAMAKWSAYVDSGRSTYFERDWVRLTMTRYEMEPSEETELSLVSLINQITVEPTP